MARPRFGDPDYYQRPERDAVELGIPEPVETPRPSPVDQGPEPDLGIPEPDLEVSYAPGEVEELVETEPAEPAFTMAKQPEAPLATEQDKAEGGWWANAGSGLMNRVGDLLANLGEFGQKVTGNIPDTPIPRIMGAKLVAKWTREGGEAIKEHFDYGVRGDWETVEDAWAKVADTEEIETLDVLDAATQTGEFMLETGIVSLPDMFAMAVAMPAYLGSRVEEIATDRAAKNGRDEPSAEDYAVGATTATIVTGIDKLSLNFAAKPLKELLERGAAAAMKRIAKATAVETAQEAVQEGLEYAGTSVGTEEGATLEEGLRRSLAGGVGGAGFGAGISTAAELISAVVPPTAAPTVPPDVEIESFADTVTGESGQRVTRRGEAPSPVDDDFLPTVEEGAVGEEDIITPPATPAPGAPEPVAEKSAATTEAPPESVTEITEKSFEERVADAWKGKGIKKPQKDFVVKHGIMPEDVEPTGKAGSYTLGDLQRAFNARKSVESDEQLTQVLKDAGLKEAAVSTEGDGGEGGAGAGPVIAGEGEAADVEPGAAEEAAAEPSPLKFTRGTKQIAEAAGLTTEELATIEVNAQGNIPRAAVEQMVREKGRVDRGDVSKETAEVLDYVEDNFPLGKYDTAKTGRTRQGKLSDKVAAVSSLVTLVDRLRKNSTAPEEVLTRAGELATDYKRIGQVSADQEAGKGFTSTIKAGVLDPLLDELSELATALDQNRPAKEGTVSASKKLKEVVKVIEEKVAAKEPVKVMETKTVAERKAALASKRAKIRKAKQIANRMRGAEARAAALKKTTEAEETLASEETNLDKQASVTEKAEPTQKKRAKPGEKVSTPKGEDVKAAKFTSASEARNVMNKLGVPELVTGVTGKISDLPIDPNHYSLMVGLYKKFRGQETAAVKSKDAAGEQAAKAKQRKLASITKDIISTPDELREGAHTKAASDLAKMGVPKTVIDDVIDFAESSRQVTQREQKRAADINEEIREIAAEEDFDDYGELAEDEEFGGESDTITLSDEYDPNEEAYGEEFRQYAPGYFGTDEQASKDIPGGHDRRREAQARSLASVLDAVSPKMTRAMRNLGARARSEMSKTGYKIIGKVNPMENEGKPLNGAAVLDFINKSLPPWHPMKVLTDVLSKMDPRVDVIFAPTGEGARRAAGFHDFGIALSQDEFGEWQWNGGNPRIVIDTAKFMLDPGRGVKVLMHEFVHHFTAANTKMDNEAAQYIDQLRIATLQAVDDAEIYDTFEGTTRKLGGGELYGLSNVDEFIAEAFTNPEFQYLLMSLEAPRTSQFGGKRSGTPKSLWQAFIEAIKRVVGIPQVSNSVLEEVVAHSDNIFYNAEERYTTGPPLSPQARIATHWSDRPHRTTTGETVRYTKTAGEATISTKWATDRAMVEDAARKNLGGERGADWGRQAHETMEGNDPETTGDLRDGSPAAQERVVQKLSQAIGENASISKIREWVGASSLALQTMDQILRNHGSKFGGKLNTYMDGLRNRNRIAQRWQNRGAAIDEQWEAVEKSGNAQRFSQFVQDITTSEVQPDFSWDRQKHLFSKNEKAVKEAQHAEMSARFNKLSNAEKKLFKDMRRFFTAQRKELAHSAVKHVTRTHINDPQLAETVYNGILKHGSVEKAAAADPEIATAVEGASPHMKESLDRIMKATKVRGAYFPLRRYGDWVVDYSRQKDLGTYDTKKEAVAATREWLKEHPSNKAKKPTKTASGQYHALVEENGVEFFETVGEGKSYIRELGGDGWTTKDSPTAKEDWGGRFDVGALQVLQQAKKKFKPQGGESKAEKARNEAVTAALDTAFIELLADTSIRKSTLQRKNTRGASLEGRRVFAERVFAGSYALADSETMFDQNNALQDVWNVAREGGVDAYKQGQVAREMTLRERHNVNDRRSNRFNDWVGSLGFLGFLAGPSYPIINATQPYMVGLPWLGARYGAGATGALFKNAGKLGPAIMKELVDSGMGLRRNPHQAVQNAINAIAKQGGGGADMLRAMRDAGIMDSTFIDAVSEAAKAGSWNISQSGIFKFAASAPKVVEVVNRTVMAATAYQLEMAKSGNEEKATDVAKEAILQTQFDYSDFNKPRWFKHPVARPFLLFKMYPQGIYALLASSVRQMTTGSKEEARQGRNTLLGLTASHTIMGGALGGIFMEPVRMMLSAIEMLWPVDDDDKENMPFWDKQQFDINMRQMAVDVLGDPWVAELAMRGIPRAFGLDLSGRLGLHNLMFMGMADDGTGKNAVHKTIDQLGGAPLSVMTSWERAYQFAINGNMQRAMETAAPKALRDMMGTYRAGTDGLETFSGTRYANPSEFDPMDHFMKMMGFSSAKKAELMEERWAQMSYDKKMTARRGQWLNRLHNGAATFAEVNKQWNAKHPDFRITMADLLRKRQGQMKDELLTSKGYPLKQQKPSIRQQARF